MKVGLLTLSNPASKERAAFFMQELDNMSVEYQIEKSMFLNTTPQQRAQSFNQMLQDPGLDYIFDISGGDLASLTLPYLDYEGYKNIRAYFVGYSDTSSVLNALVQHSQKPALLFQPSFHAPMGQVQNWLYQQETDLFSFACLPLIDAPLEGEVVGGNIRCLLKTAGTKYFPDTKGKVLFLESNSGDVNRIEAYFGQLIQMGVLENVQGILLGQFSQLDQSFGFNSTDQILSKIMTSLAPDYKKALWRTHEIGHSADSKALWLGRSIQIAHP
jgi:muramoyltetrapeptide carboxypeptidase LdcA involved in peptidoglycan recycling